ncbi:MAG: FG-GAP-like repeat-containing protein, partial [Myxococcaceae bacterium]
GSQVAIGDVDGDGKPDLAVGSPRDDVTVNESGAVYLYRLGPDGPMALRPPLSRIGAGRFGSALALADVDGDGDLDLAAGAPESDPELGGRHRGTVDVFLLQAGREIPEVSDLTLGGGDLDPSGVYTADTTSALQFGSTIATADFNRDGKADLAVGSVVNNTRLRAGKRQPVVWVYLSRGGARPFRAVPDAVVVPSIPEEAVEGRLQVGAVVGPGGLPLLLTGLDQADTPDLSASGGNPARQDGGGVFLFDLSGLSALAEPPASPPQIVRAEAFAQLYSARSFDRMGRSFATIDVDGQPGDELVLGAINAAGEPPKPYPLAGRLSAYPLSTLTRGTVTNSPFSWRQGQVAEVLGTGLVTWRPPFGDRLVATLSRADTSFGVATGRVDVLTRAGSGLSEWTATSHEVPATPANEKFGSVLAAGHSATGAPLALVAAPNTFGPAENKDNPGAGKVFLFDPVPSGVAREVAPAPLVGNSRPVGSDLGFTDFDGDGRQDLLIGLPGYVVPGSHREAQNSATYEVVRSECLGAADEVVGAVEVQLAQADGSFVPAHRIWAPRKIPACSSTEPDACVRTRIGSHLVGGFDFNGDGRQDLAATRLRGLEIFAGRPVDSPQLAKLTMGCDPLFSAPATRVTSAPASLGDLDGDGCDDVGYRYQDSGFAIVFGFDPSGARCGGKTTATTLQIGGFDRLAGGDLRLGGAAARVRNFFGDGRDFVAVSAGSMPFEAVRQSGVLLFDVATLLQRRVVGSSAQVEAYSEGMDPVPLLHRETATGFGASLASGIDLTGDGMTELVVGATEANVGKPSSGGVFVFSGVGQSPGRMEPFLPVAGEMLEKSLFGARVSWAPANGGSAPFLLIGAPNSFRTGTQNGTAWYLPLPAP